MIVSYGHYTSVHRFSVDLVWPRRHSRQAVLRDHCFREKLVQPVDADSDREAPTGQHALPFIVDTRPPTPTASRRRENAERRRLEAARASYLAALDAHSEHLEARINLGRLLHLNGELERAEKTYREAKKASALLSFNLAILLEDLNREEEGILAYREALALDPSMHDAHFNLSRLHERADRPREALQHLLTYRRHTLRED